MVSQGLRRRTLLAGAGAGLTVWLAGCQLPVFPKRPAPDADAAAGWLRFADGRYTLFLPRIEMGQHIDSALRQIAAEELGIAPQELTVQLPSTADITRVRATVGSESVSAFALPLAQACATLREALARGERSGTLAPEPVPMSALRAFRAGARWVGQSLPHASQAAVVRGLPLFAADVRRPGMWYGRVLRAPSSPDLVSVPPDIPAPQLAAARAVPGFVALVHEPGLRLGNSLGLGLLARTPGALDRIEAALALRWPAAAGRVDDEVSAAIDIDQRLAEGGLPHRVVNDALDTDGAWDVDLRLDLPAAAHGGLEPRCAVAEFDAAGQLQVWTGTQDAFFVRDVLAQALALDTAQVTVRPQRIGGAFGGRTICTVELEAALLARAAGAPVKVQWTRVQELRQGFHRPPSSHRVRVRLQQGRMTAWWHAFVTTPILLTNAALPAWLNPITRVIGDAGAARGAALPYRVPAQRIEFALKRLPLFTGPWRGLGAGPNAWAMESAIDEAARLAGADALAFRLAHDPPPRLARVLQRVAAAAGWDRPPRPGSGRGLACGIYKERSFVATVAEVALRRGRWCVTRLVCAVDVGRLIHPDAVRAQCEGNLVWGLAMVLSDQLPLQAGGVAATGFDGAPLLRLDEVPPIELLLVDEGDAPGGAGETAIVGAAAAVANAWRDATGRRPGRWPLSEAERVADRTVERPADTRGARA